MNEPIRELQMIPNDNADEVSPHMWKIFIGRWAVIPFIGGIFFISLMNICSFMGFDFWMSFIIAIAPSVIMTVLVIVFVNSKPPGYTQGLSDMLWWKVYTWLYLHGYTDRPRQIWYSGQPLKHPRA